MAIDPLSETVVSFSQGARRLPRLRQGRPVHPSTLFRWAQAGLHGIRLETVKVGGTRCTSIEAIQRFLAALNGSPILKAPMLQKEHDEAVERELGARGV